MVQLYRRPAGWSSRRWRATYDEKRARYSLLGSGTTLHFLLERIGAALHVVVDCFGLGCLDSGPGQLCIDPGLQCQAFGLSHALALDSGACRSEFLPRLVQFGRSRVADTRSV